MILCLERRRHRSTGDGQLVYISSHVTSPLLVVVGGLYLVQFDWNDPMARGKIQYPTAISLRRRCRWGHRCIEPYRDDFGKIQQEEAEIVKSLNCWKNQRRRVSTRNVTDCRYVIVAVGGVPLQIHCGDGVCASQPWIPEERGYRTHSSTIHHRPETEHRGGCSVEVHSDDGP
jgi:hypothetical protein